MTIERQLKRMVKMFKFMRKLRRDVGTVNSWANLGRKAQGGYFKGKQRMIVLAAVIGVYVATKIAKVAPKVAGKMIGFIRRKKRPVGRGTEVREKKAGNIQDAVIEEEKISKEELEEIEEHGTDIEDGGYKDTGESEYGTTVNKDKVDKVREMYEEGEQTQETNLNNEEIRLIGQVIEACKQYNKTESSMKVKYELIGNELYIDMEGNNTIVSKDGITSMSGNVYYDPHRMSKDDAITRLALEYPIQYVSLLVLVVVAYEEDVFNIEDYSEIEKDVKESKRELDLEEKEREVERTKDELRRKQMELDKAHAIKHLDFRE